MHNGSIGDYPLVKKRLEALVSDEYYTCRLGSTDSELIFALALTFGLLETPVLSICRTLEAILRVIKDTPAITKPVVLACIALTNGTRVYAFRWSYGKASPSLYFGLPKTSMNDPQKMRDTNLQLAALRGRA